MGAVILAVDKQRVTKVNARFFEIQYTYEAEPSQRKLKTTFFESMTEKGRFLMLSLLFAIQVL
ncbi:hypothetical protein [Ectobacillus panaciterrae]|uniref:hypothetical protein n=1 Tax=Ectobacillus panaciterrae TaxID=363872 RepID=UPI000401ADBB|nr:hypothetical protein [Ectobacillus panaciterrae]